LGGWVDGFAGGACLVDGEGDLRRIPTRIEYTGLDGGRECRGRGEVLAAIVSCMQFPGIQHASSRCRCIVT
jgi:hypothetical protein